MPRYGSLSILDTLATYNNTSVLEFGEERLAGYLNLILNAYEGLTGEIMREFVGTVPDREIAYGVNTTSGDMIEVDEFGQADAQKIPFAPSSVAFPLRRIQYSLQWTRDYLATTSPAEMANQVLAITESDERYLYGALRRVLFRGTNSTFVDRIVDNRSLTVRALVNGDSQAIPPHPITLATFNAATHTHYMGTATYTEASLLALIDNVFEHGQVGDGGLRVYINRAQEALTRGFAGFRAYGDTRIIYSQNADRAAGSADQMNLEDRAIGFIGAAEVWVKPWMPASYVLCSLPNAAEPIVGWRRPTGAYAGFGNLRIAAELDRFPLHAQTMQRMLGFGVWNRLAGAVLYIGNSTYVPLA